MYDLDKQVWANIKLCNKMANSIDPDQTAPYRMLKAHNIQNLRLLQYRKNHKILDTQKFAVIILKVEQDGFSLE